MQAATYHGREDIRVEDVEDGTVAPEQVRIDVEVCGICGSDLHEYAAGPIFVPEGDPHPVSGETAPIRMGHEYSGTVTEVGSAVEDLDQGDAVAVNPVLYCGACRQCRRGDYHICDSVGFLGLSGGDGGFAESAVIDAEHAVPLGDDVPVEHGALVEPLAVGLHAVRRSGLQAGDAVAVFGSGPIGLAVIQCARAAGAGTIYVSEPRDARRERASDCGADELVDPSSTDAVEHIVVATGGGVDVAFEVAGVEASFNAAIESTAPGGRTTIVSIWEETVNTHPNDLVLAERTLTGTLAYLGGPRADEEYGMVIEMLGDGRLDPDPFITGRIGLEEIVEDGFEQLLDPGSDHVKILVKPN
ncbi:2,3-butanediol dehydrogenase [Halosolutus amylolyticus]|uniref:2,3-butanediol dehydrogenase n=1 Tax=Halosolutus amylolyticus TaxID=2932267 RepID=A0ABD5PUW1_9EURY|nr:2,3-butanediol dehydrogenase [Halosolutus amylolyticus]